MAKVYAVIMAGGRGERFWPLSTELLPKPFVGLLGTNSLLQQTVERLLPLIPADRIIISIAEAQEAVARAQLPAIPPQNYVIEPVGRDTAACIGYCALHLEELDPECSMLAVPADHHVPDAEAFRRSLEMGIRSLAGASAVVFGIRPSRPETGYGYIQAEKPSDTAEAWPVIRFVEKPDAHTAADYLRAGNFFWNSGMFLWRNATLLALFEKHMPETYAGLRRLAPLLGRPETMRQKLEIFGSLPRISIDYGILEKAAGLRLVPAGFEWDDIGNWQALERMRAADSNGNIAVGPFALLESSGCITYTDADMVAAFGVSDLVIVQARGRVLVCHKSKAAELKRLVSMIDLNRR